MMVFSVVVYLGYVLFLKKIRNKQQNFREIEVLFQSLRNEVQSLFFQNQKSKKMIHPWAAELKKTGIVYLPGFRILSQFFRSFSLKERELQRLSVLMKTRFLVGIGVGLIVRMWLQFSVEYHVQYEDVLLCALAGIIVNFGFYLFNHFLPSLRLDKDYFWFWFKAYLFKEEQWIKTYSAPLEQELKIVRREEQRSGVCQSNHFRQILEDELSLQLDEFSKKIDRFSDMMIFFELFFIGVPIFLLLVTPVFLQLDA